MKKKTLIYLFLFLGFFYPLHSEINQGEILYKDPPPHRKINMYIDFISNIHHNIVEKNVFSGPLFSTDSLKFDLRGKANEKISYRFVQQMKPKDDEDPKMDHSTIINDVAYLKYKFHDQLYLLIGKQPFSFGSMEYSGGDFHVYPPYTYTDVLKKENPIGINFIYTPKKNHEIQFQIVNNIYTKQFQSNTTEKKISYPPIGYSINWNGDFFKKHLKNRWSYSIFQEKDKEKFWKLLALGSKLDLKPISIEADYIFSDEDIEKNGEITKIFRSLNLASVKYGNYFLKLKYNILPQWYLFAKGMYEIGIYKELNVMEKNKSFKKSYNYSGGIEYRPIKHYDDLRLYFIYQQNNVYYLYFMKQKNKNDHNFSFGLSYRVKLF
ncbi:porin [Blattabacterium cuenoti]|uniref:porin n=1 Tax=Blattabacterium cuenoti TaxID=1653831 RepID=UPI00163CBA50|nr:porin [Blattabacterium cuenoti]